ncbi:hypothetical protein DL93DRAFT_2092071, partial [Clavulina sp. PMI_390]
PPLLRVSSSTSSFSSLTYLFSSLFSSSPPLLTTYEIFLCTKMLSVSSQSAALLSTPAPAPSTFTLNANTPPPSILQLACRLP